MNQNTQDCKSVKIVCDVANCAYHSNEHTCNATEIGVGPNYACSCQDTACTTFKPNK